MIVLVLRRAKRSGGGIVARKEEEGVCGEREVMRGYEVLYEAYVRTSEIVEHGIVGVRDERERASERKIIMEWWWWMSGL